MKIKCITDFKWVEQNTFTMYVNLMLCRCSLSTNVTTLRVVSVKTEETLKKNFFYAFYQNAISNSSVLNWCPAVPLPPWCQLLGIHHLNEIKALAGS